MGTVTYYVALAFKRSEEGGDIVAYDPKEARSPDQAIRMATSLARMEGHCGAIAFSRTGDPALGDFADAVILKTIGEVDIAIVSVASSLARPTGERQLCARSGPSLMARRTRPMRPEARIPARSRYGRVARGAGVRSHCDSERGGNPARPVSPSST
jgi:hypothetical protein